jgi:eukaryotic-like serine/threonine-protein kinase
MSPERYQKAGHLFHAALEVEPESRAAFLDEECGADFELRREVESLLAAHDKVGDYFAAPAMEVAAGLIAPGQSPSLMGRSISHYKVLSLIGAGGMGEVYLAEDARLGRKVALKLLPAAFTQDRERVRRFEQEARATSALNHPNILTIFEVGQVDGHHFIATEYVEGQTLRQRLTVARLKLWEALDVAEQIISALTAAHRAGTVHRDIKPENVMVRPDNLVKVLDFGLAKLAERRPESAASNAATMLDMNTTPGLVLGTVSYMSPEQARGIEVDARSDIFSLGVVMYEMVAGQSPFAAESSAETLAAILEREPLPLVRFGQNVPDELERIVGKALRKERDERYQSAADLAIDLKSLKQEMEVEARLKRSVQPDVGGGQTTTKGDRRQAAEPNREPTAAIDDVATARSMLSAEYLVGEIKRNRRGAMLWLAGIVAIVTLTFCLRTPAPPPKVSAYTKITRDNRLKSFFVTDGARVYFTSWDAVAGGNYQVTAAGGESIPIPSNGPALVILDISPDYSELLMAAATSDVGEWPLWVQPVLGGSPRRVGDLSAHFAAWSPDGSQIVYGSGSDLLVARADGSGARRLTSTDGIPELPRWSPDGRRVRFTVKSPKDNSVSLWGVEADGSNLRPLLPGWNSAPQECCGNWTADGRYYFFQSTRNGATSVWAIREEGGPFGTADREPVQVTTGPIDFSKPLPSRDGKKLFAIGDLRRGELVRYDGKSGQVVPFMQGVSVEHLDFSRDGEWVTYVSYPEATLWRSKVDGTDRLQLTSAPMQAALPRWSPDRRQVAFAAAAPGQPWKIYVIPADGGTAQQLMPELRTEIDATWSPDGNQMAIGFSLAETGSSNMRGIHIHDLRTKQTSMLPGSENLFSPRWSPDGRYISATSMDNEGLMLFDLATKRWEALARAHVVYPSWSRDGKHVYFGTSIKGDTAVMRVRVRDRQIEQVADLKNIKVANGVFGPWVGLTTDGSPLVLRYIGTQEIYALDLQVQ